MSQPLKKMVKIKVAAEKLGVTPQTIRNWVASGRLSALRHPVNGYRLFNLSEIERLLASTETPLPWQGSLFSEPQKDEPMPTVTYSLDKGKATRLIQLSDNPVLSTVVVGHDTSSAIYEESAQYDYGWLRQKEKPPTLPKSREIRIGDAFCGGGIFSIGVDEGLRSLSYKASHVFGIDFAKEPIDTFSHNFPDAIAIHGDILSFTNGPVGSPPTADEEAFLNRIGHRLDILIGGPPCQGHSDLNNHSRRADPKNALYFSMVRLAELLKPSFVIIENVPGVVHDKGQVVQKSESELSKLGYHVSMAKFDLRQLGIPQKRKRFVLVASKLGKLNLEKVRDDFLTTARPISWAIEDLIDSYDEEEVYSSSSNHSEENKRRINYLFAHNLFELPNEQRPPCHRDKKHSYNSVYGRMKWDEPAPTITGGFGSTGQGRFVHPTIPRTLTPHEACRVQFVPDFFTFPSTVKRRAMQQIIGNAAPPRLSEVIVLGAAIQGVLF